MAVHMRKELDAQEQFKGNGRSCKGMGKDARKWKEL